MKILLIFLLLTQIVFGQDVSYLTNGDTVVWSKKDTSVLLSYPVYTKTVKPFKKPASSYLVLPLSQPIILSGKSNVIIEGKRFVNAPGAAITVTNCSNIIIRNCFFDSASAEGITLYNCTNITIEKNLFAKVTTGVYASTSKTVKVIGNQFVNVRKRLNENARGQFVQFNNVTGAGNIIENNKGENFQGESNPEDLISMFGGSSGTAVSPISIRNNIFRGGGPSKSGGGIVAGDHGGGYIKIDSNTLMNPGQYGIAIAGGSYNVITNNKIYSRQFPWSNNPLFIWMQAGSTACNGNTIKSNRTYWVHREGWINDGWNAGNCSNTIWERPTRITEAEMNVPSHLIDFITPEELLQIRK